MSARFRLSDLKWFFIIVIAWLIMLGPGVVGQIEGSILPAAAKMTLERVEPAADNEPPDRIRTNFWGSSARLRPNCNYHSIKIWLGTRTGRNVPANIRTGAAIVRPDGAFSFGPWRTNIPPKELWFNSFMNVYHRCETLGIPHPWLTVTKFYR